MRHMTVQRSTAHTQANSTHKIDTAQLIAMCCWMRLVWCGVVCCTGVGSDAGKAQKVEAGIREQ